MPEIILFARSLLCPNSRIQTLSPFEDYYQLRPAVNWTQKDSDLDFNPSQSKLRTGNRFVRESNASDSLLGFCFQVKALLSVNSAVGASDIVHWGQECNRPPSRLEPREASQRPFGALGRPGKKNCEPFECPGRWIFWVVKKMQPGGGLAWDRDVFRSFFQPPGRFNNNSVRSK